MNLNLVKQRGKPTTPTPLKVGERQMADSLISRNPVDREVQDKQFAKKITVSGNMRKRDEDEDEKEKEPSKQDRLEIKDEEKEEEAFVPLQPKEDEYIPVELEEKKSPPHVPIEQSTFEHSNSTKSSLVSSIIFWSILLMLFLPLYTVSATCIVRNMSVGQAIHHLAFSSSVPSTQARAAYPLNAEKHDTHSVPIVLHHSYARPLVMALEHSFRHHLAHNSVSGCLCMHHLKFPSETLYQLCAIYNQPSNQIYLVANPRLIGNTSETTAYKETSVSCPPTLVLNRNRFNTIMLEWIVPGAKSETMYATFKGDEAACMQLALEEMEGNKHCQK